MYYSRWLPSMWIPIIAWRKLAEIIGEYCAKGQLVYISGKYQSRSYEDKEGIKRYMTEIVADKMLMLGGKGREDNPPTKGLNPINGHSEHDIPDDDIPF